MIKLEERVEAWSKGLSEPNVARLFRMLAYGWMLCNALYFFPIRTHLWGEISLLMPFRPDPSLINNLAYFLGFNPEYGLMGFYLYIVSIVVALIGVGGRIPRVLVFLTGWLVYYGCMPVFNSSLLLYQVFAFFLIFFAKPTAKGGNAIVSHLALWACRIQFILVYALAGIYKATGTTWWEGSSIWYSLHLDYFVSDSVRDFFISQTWLLYLGNYFGFFYQLLFPILIWWKPARIPLFIAGVAFHGFIGTIMNLPEFALAMIIGYTLFFEEEKSRKWLAFFRLSPKNQKSDSTMRSTV